MHSEMKLRDALSIPVCGRQFFGTELHSPYDVHFLKADGMWITMVRLKMLVVECL